MNFKYITSTTVSCLAILFTSYANSATLTFDDTAPFYEGDYNGFTLTNSGVFSVSANLYTNWSSAYSGDNVMTNANDQIGSISIQTGSFDFSGAHFFFDHVAPGGAQTVNFAGFDEFGVQQYSSTLVVLREWQYILFDWNNITTFTWDPEHPSSANIAIDDFNYELSSIPIPGAMWLFASGLIGLVSVAKRKKK